MTKALKKTQKAIEATPEAPLAVCENLASFPPDCVPFRCDMGSMGTPVTVNGQNLYLMQYMDELYMVNTKTGKRFALTLTEDFFKPAEAFVTHLLEVYDMAENGAEEVLP